MTKVYSGSNPKLSAGASGDAIVRSGPDGRRVSATVDMQIDAPYGAWPVDDARRVAYAILSECRIAERKARRLKVEE